MKYEVVLNVEVQFDTIVEAEDMCKAYFIAIEEMKKKEIDQCIYWDLTSSETKECQ